jgi:hypothetical protein
MKLKSAEVCPLEAAPPVTDTVISMVDAHAAASSALSADRLLKAAHGSMEAIMSWMDSVFGCATPALLRFVAAALQFRQRL